MKKNIAYKTAKGLPDYPDGFILESMETDEDTLDGYTVVPRDSFHDLMLASTALMQDFIKTHPTRQPDNKVGQPRIPKSS